MRSNHPRGFTLVEIMVVIVILGALAAIVVPNLSGILGKSERDIARMQMRQIGHAVEMYDLSHRQLPEDLATLTEPDPDTNQPLLREIPRDPWNSDYEYRRFITEHLYQLRCLGRDRQAETDDDLIHPNEER